MGKLIILALNLILIIVPSYSEVPSYVKICGQKNPKFNDCVKESIEQLRPKLSVGMPEFHVPSIEPLPLPGGLTLADTESFAAKTDKMNLHGVSTLQIKYLNFDADNKKLDFDIFFDKLNLTADYDIKAKIIVPISAHGPIELEIDNVLIKVNLKFKLVTKKNKVYMYFSSMTCKLTMKDYVSRYIPQPGQDSTLAEAITSVLNSNKDDIIMSVKENLEKSISVKVLEIANGVTKHFAYNELVPETESK